MASHQTEDGMIILDMPDRCKGESMTAWINRAREFNTLAHEADIIDLEAKCRIADALELIAMEIAHQRGTR
ncbi:hypothetical protein EP30_02370 [Bifidobacterium sp. UTCIF-39]|uniref:hypothetical protein n=1 Tax=Bifidobacterium sp. UTCIF-39 TaxID=1465359 RepID=UPI00112A7F8B|nr:hypothetical protein [Bifidobacterium sp. UTCIF-39]TPF97458.1 hypothetical protein EP30_02370 [Bifidobacterium sp. UTCIF-39]